MNGSLSISHASTEAPKRTPFSGYLPQLLLILVMFVAALLPASPIFGEWESFTAYSVYGSQDAQLTIAISPYGNVGGQNYFVLELSRRILEATGLPVSLAAMRIPSVICGVVSLGFFYVIGKRWFGAWPSLVGTSLLAVNPIFSQYMHELTVLAPSLMAFILFLERLQLLTRKPNRLWSWVSCSFSLALVLLLYGPGRIMVVIILIGWSAFMLWRPESLGIRKSVLLGGLAIVACGASATLVALHPKNLLMLGPQLLFPRLGESALITDSGVSLAQTLIMNSRIAAESLFLAGGAYHSTFLEATLIQGRFPTFPIFIAPIVAIGLVLCVSRLRLDWRGLCSKEAALLGLFAVTTVPMLTSSVFLQTDFGGQPLQLSSLVNFRLAYALVPGYLLATLVTAWVTPEDMGTRHRALRMLSTGLIAVCLLGASIFASVAGRESFRERIQESDPTLVGNSGWVQWLSGYSLADRSISWGSHFQQHNQYRVAARSIAGAMPSSQESKEPVIAWMPLACFPEAPLKTHSLGEIQQLNYHSFFLSTYLGDSLSGSSVGFVFVPTKSREHDSRGGKRALWSASLTRTDDASLLEYAEPGVPRVVSLNGQPIRIVVATTPFELEYLTTLREYSEAQLIELSSDGCSGQVGKALTNGDP